jgi:hypothetical protein
MDPRGSRAASRDSATTVLSYEVQALIETRFT